MLDKFLKKKKQKKQELKLKGFLNQIQDKKGPLPLKDSPKRMFVLRKGSQASNARN